MGIGINWNYHHEVIQGLVATNNTHIPICIVPTGSGNGMATSLNICSINDAIKRIEQHTSQKRLF